MTGTTFWDGATAIGTLAMAVTTYWIIRQNRTHHQDAFRPICVLVAENGTDAVARRDIVQLHTESNDPTKYFRILCSIKNVGTGPTAKLRLVMRSIVNPEMRAELELPPLGSNDTFPGPMRIPVFLHDRFNESDYRIAPGDGWELWLLYEDVFGNQFHTRHNKNPQLPWGVPGKGGLTSNG